MDIGCGGGDFLLGARALGMQVRGVEMSDSAANTARQQGLRCDGTGIDGLAELTERYDVIRLSDVLEHLTDPLEALKAIAKTLSPAGVVIIKVPNVDGVFARLCGREWFPIEAPRHLWGFGRSNLEMLLGQAGLRARRISDYESGIRPILQPAQSTRVASRTGASAGTLERGARAVRQDRLGRSIRLRSETTLSWSPNAAPKAVWLSERIPFMIGAVLRKLHGTKRRDQSRQAIHIKLTDHCNLNCIGCNVFSPISERVFLDTARYTEDVKRLRELLGDTFDVILMGGEPLLHPDIVELLYTTRRLLKKADISVVTNGVLAMRQGDSFWHALKENDITVRTTKYPIDVDYDGIEERCKQNGIRFTYHDGEDTKTTRYVQGIDPKGTGDAGGNFHRCVQRHCTSLENGKLYPCPVIPSIVHFNKYFGCDIPISADDYLDIYQADSGRSVRDHTCDRKGSVPFCSYCDLDARLSSCVDYKRSSKDMSEWVSAGGSADEAPQG